MVFSNIKGYQNYYREFVSGCEYEGRHDILSHRGQELVAIMQEGFQTVIPALGSAGHKSLCLCLYHESLWHTWHGSQINRAKQQMHFKKSDPICILSSFLRFV